MFEIQNHFLSLSDSVQSSLSIDFILFDLIRILSPVSIDKTVTFCHVLIEDKISLCNGFLNAFLFKSKMASRRLTFLPTKPQMPALDWI